MNSLHEKFSLKWNNFPETLAVSYSDLRSSNDFSDVTLLSEDDSQFEAHRLILSASSPFFQNILKKTNHSHPMVYMRGLNAKELRAILDFIYLGQVEILQDDLDDFLALGEELQLKGLSGILKESLMQIPQKTETIEFHSESELHEISKTSIGLDNIKNNENEFQRTVLNPSDLKNTIKLMMKKISVNAKDGDEENCWMCIECGTNSHKESFITHHIENVHLGRMAFKCDMCEKMPKSIDALRKHKARRHTQVQQNPTETLRFAKSLIIEAVED